MIFSLFLDNNLVIRKTRGNGATTLLLAYLASEIIHYGGDDEKSVLFVSHNNNESYRSLNSLYRYIQIISQKYQGVKFDKVFKNNRQTLILNKFNISFISLSQIKSYCRGKRFDAVVADAPINYDDYIYIYPTIAWDGEIISKLIFVVSDDESEMNSTIEKFSKSTDTKVIYLYNKEEHEPNKIWYKKTGDGNNEGILLFLPTQIGNYPTNKESWLSISW